MQRTRFCHVKAAGLVILVITLTNTGIIWVISMKT